MLPTLCESSNPAAGNYHVRFRLCESASVLRLIHHDNSSHAISTVNAAYDGLKTSLNIMVQLTDGLDWPIKAIPQTVLYILKLFEVRSRMPGGVILTLTPKQECRAVQAKVTELLVEVQSLWSIVSTVHRPADTSRSLATHMREFYE